jgi:transcriptional regulator with XRE-family HTH domain
MMAKAASKEARSFGLAVRARREAIGVSQEALAQKARLHRTYVGSVERGERNVTLKNIYVLAHALGISIVDLIADADSLLKR